MCEQMSDGFLITAISSVVYISVLNHCYIRNIPWADHSVPRSPIFGINPIYMLKNK